MDKNKLPDTLCLECMSNTVSDGVCTACGCDNSQKPEGGASNLRPGTVLNDRFAIGKARYESSLTTVYYAYDLEEQKRVTVECAIDKKVRSKYYTKLYQYGRVWVEGFDHYAKQTYRNRCVIAAADGPLALTIPTEKGDEDKCRSL